MEEEIYKSTVKGKAIFYSSIIVLLLFALLIDSNWFAQLVFPDNSGYTIEQSNAHMIKFQNYLIIFSFVFLLFSFGLALLLYKFGRRIQKAQQYPPPGANMPFSMKIRRGKKALQKANNIYIESVLTIALGIFQLVFQIYCSSRIKSIIDII